MPAVETAFIRLSGRRFGVSRGIMGARNTGNLAHAGSAAPLASLRATPRRSADCGVWQHFSRHGLHLNQLSCNLNGMGWRWSGLLNCDDTEAD